MGFELVLFTGVVIADIVDEAQVEILSKEEQEVRDEAKRVRDQIEADSIAIRGMDQQLQKDNAVLVQELQRLQFEHKQLLDRQADEALKNRGQADKDNDDPFSDYDEDDDGIEEAIQAELKRAEEKKAKKNKRKNPLEQAKRLFRKIANITHPDKTKNKRYHALFIRAKEARESLDIDALELILREVTEKGNILNSLLLRLEVAQRELMEARMDRERQEHSDSYRMLQDWKNPSCRTHVRTHFAELVNKNIEELQKTLHDLDPEGFPLPQQTIIFTTSRRF